MRRIECVRCPLVQYMPHVSAQKHSKHRAILEKYENKQGYNDIIYIQITPIIT